MSVRAKRWRFGIADGNRDIFDAKNPIGSSLSIGAGPPSRVGLRYWVPKGGAKGGNESSYLGPIQRKRKTIQFLLHGR